MGLSFQHSRCEGSQLWLRLWDLRPRLPNKNWQLSFSESHLRVSQRHTDSVFTAAKIHAMRNATISGRLPQRVYWTCSSASVPVFRLMEWNAVSHCLWNAIYYKHQVWRAGKFSSKYWINSPMRDQGLEEVVRITLTREAILISATLGGVLIMCCISYNRAN